MIPPILTLIPAYVLILNMGLKNTYWALILPWTSGGQVFALLLCRSFFATLPEEFFDAARIDGATELQSFAQIAVPLSMPILVTVAVVRLVTTYNQFMWPLVVIDSPKRQVVSVALTQFTSELGVTDLGPQMAGYLVSGSPDRLVFFRHETLCARPDRRRFESVNISTVAVLRKGRIAYWAHSKVVDECPAPLSRPE